MNKKNKYDIRLDSTSIQLFSMCFVLYLDMKENQSINGIAVSYLLTCNHVCMHIHSQAQVIAYVKNFVFLVFFFVKVTKKVLVYLFLMIFMRSTKNRDCTKKKAVN